MSKAKVTRAKKLDVRTQALEVALRLMAARGYDGTSLQDVATEMGVTKQALLHHFGSKEMLKLEVLDAVLARAHARFLDIVQATGGLEGTSMGRALLTHLERFLDEEPYAAPLTLRLILDRDTAAVERMKDRARPWAAVLEEHLEQGRAEGRLRAGMSAEMALTHLGTLVVATVACVPLGGWGRRPSKSWRREQLEQLLRTIGLVCFPDDKRPPGVFGAGT